MFGKVQAFIERKNQIYNGFLEHCNYMSPGVYQWDDTLRFIVKDDPDTAREALQVFYNYYGKTARIVLWLLRNIFFRKKIVVNGNEAVNGRFTGEVYRPFRSINNYRDKKLFNFDEGKVLAIFSKEADYKRTLDIYKKFHSYFPMPKILWKHHRNWEICEELVDFIPIEKWTKDDCQFVMNDVLMRSSRYLQKESSSVFRVLSPRMEFWRLDNKQEIQLIYNMITPHLLRESHPCIQLHGDLWRSNTLLMKDQNLRKVTYIDWEYSEELPFFYDIFTFIWLDVFVSQEDFYFNRYLAGEYDSDLRKIFSFFGLTFDPKYRMDYFHIYFLYFYKFRLVDLPKFERLPYINRYKHLIQMSRS